MSLINKWCHIIYQQGVQGECTLYIVWKWPSCLLQQLKLGEGRGKWHLGQSSHTILIVSQSLWSFVLPCFGSVVGLVLPESSHLVRALGSLVFGSYSATLGCDVRRIITVVWPVFQPFWVMALNCSATRSVSGEFRQHLPPGRVHEELYACSCS